MKINMKEYNLDSFSKKDVYSWDEIISVIENLEEELHDYKNNDNDEQNDTYESIMEDTMVDEDRNTLAYSINLERND